MAVWEKWPGIVVLLVEWEKKIHGTKAIYLDWGNGLGIVDLQGEWARELGTVDLQVVDILFIYYENINEYLYQVVWGKELGTVDLP